MKEGRLVVKCTYGDAEEKSKRNETLVFVQEGRRKTEKNVQPKLQLLTR